MSKIAHRLAMTGAWSQLVLAISYTVAAWQTSAAVGAMSIRIPGNMDAVMAEVTAVTHALSDIADRLVIGLLIALAGYAVFVFALTRLRYRRRWAFRFCCLYGSLLLLCFPLGTPFGLFLLIYGLIHRAEFDRVVLRDSEGSRENVGVA